MTPQWFAEDFLRVYTKKPQFFGIVQAGYRAVLANMPNEFDLERLETLVVPGSLDLNSNMALTPPATEEPSTPKMKVHSRDNSFSFPCASTSTTLFSNNSFTTVPPTFTPGSPSRNGKKRRNASGKRLHNDDSSLSQLDGHLKKKQKQ